MGMGVLPVQDFESRQLVNKLNNIDSRYKSAAPILTLDNKSDQEDDDIDEDSMSIKVDEEDKDTYVSGPIQSNLQVLTGELTNRKENIIAR